MINKIKNKATIIILIIIFTLSIFSTVIAATELPVTPVTVDLFAGQTIDAGNVSVWNDSENLYVKYETSNGWMLKETHLSVKAALSEIPQTSGKKPVAIPGKFDYKNIYMPSVSEDTYVISLEELGFAYNQMIYISAHAVVEKQLEDGTIQTETGWAAGTKFGGSWGTYFTYTIQKPVIVEDEEKHTYTSVGSAWGVGTKISNQGNGTYFVFDNFATDKTVVLGLGKNYINVGNIIAHYNSLDNTITVTFTTNDPYFMDQVHLYIDDEIPTITAPGQYANQFSVSSSDDYFQTYTFTIDASGFTGPIYIAAHAHIYERD